MGTKKWLDKEKEELRDMYINETQDVRIIAEHFGGKKNYRSVISKLVNMKIYIQPKKDKQLNKTTIKYYISELENLLNIKLENKNNHTRTTPDINMKSNLTLILEAVKELPKIKEETMNYENSS